jgi:hypothetical protein
MFGVSVKPFAKKSKFVGMTFIGNSLCYRAAMMNINPVLDGMSLVRIMRVIAGVSIVTA